ncbi:MAG TPA: catalase family protein [Pyrinomonadaceae bacterium]|nr:catalase family protein [Pyrinomonadaceae bacterium]
MDEQLELYTEYPQPAEEAETAANIVALMEKFMIKNFTGGRMLRDVHSKGHGCVLGEFTVHADIPEEFRVGVFKDPKTYQAVIRFSNAGALAPIGGTAPDIKRDARGMAVKLVGVPGEKLLSDERNADTQDFLMFTPNVFFCPDPEGFLELMDALTTNKLVFGWYLLTHPSVSLSLIASLKKHANLLELQYFSAVPYKLGDVAVKYSARPVLKRTSDLPNRPTDNFLRERMQAQLDQESVNYDFMVQVQKDPYAMPIENGLVPWSEDVSPFIPIATIKIFRQTFDSPQQMVDCDNLSFTPWHCLPEHRPLGSISRVRRNVYQAISKFRHERNDVPREEPTPGDIGDL